MKMFLSIAAAAGMTLALASLCKAPPLPGDSNRGPGGPRAEANERHPEMHMALHHLRQAKHALEHAAHDFDGHRVAAVKDAEDAIHEIAEGLHIDPNAPLPVGLPVVEANVPRGGLRGPLHGPDANGPRGGLEGADGNERHPLMHLAVFHLREAKRELEHAAHDYDGHRAAALKDTEAAIKEVVDGIESDKN